MAPSVLILIIHSIRFTVITIDKDEMVNSTLIYIFVIPCVLGECSWTEREFQLAAWAFRKWRYHQFTSLRVSEAVLAACFFIHLSLLALLRWKVDQGSYLINICSPSVKELPSQLSIWRTPLAHRTSRAMLVSSLCLTQFICVT